MCVLEAAGLAVRLVAARQVQVEEPAGALLATPGARGEIHIVRSARPEKHGTPGRAWGDLIGDGGRPGLSRPPRGAWGERPMTAGGVGTPSLSDSAHA